VSISLSEDFDPYQMLGEHYASMRRWTPAFLTTFTFQGVPAAVSLLRAIDVLRDMNQAGKAQPAEIHSDRFHSRAVGATCATRRRYRPALL
jgi:hypothetical protein